MGFGGSGSGNTCIGTLPTNTISGRDVGINEMDKGNSRAFVPLTEGTRFTDGDEGGLAPRLGIAAAG